MTGAKADLLSPIAAPVRSLAEIEANDTYEALMWALARPGTVQKLPSPAMAAIADSLVDRECGVFAPDDELWAAIAATGAGRVDAGRADHAFLRLDTPDGIAALAELPVGSALYPDDGATVFAHARLGEGRRVRLSGPGIESTTEILVGGLPDEVWAIRASRCLYPTGFELFLIDGDRVLGLPRSTTIEVI